MTRETFFSIQQWAWASALMAIPGLAIASLSLPALADVQSDLARLIETGSCSLCDLSNANLSGTDLEGADLSGATLVGVDFSRANLQRANLSRALLNGANLGGANFSFANLRNASLQGAVIRQPANFTGADLTDMVMPSGVTRAISPPSNSPAATTPANLAPSTEIVPAEFSDPAGSNSIPTLGAPADIRPLTDAPNETIESNVTVSPGTEPTPVDPRFPLSESQFPIDPFDPRPSAANLPAANPPAPSAADRSDSVDPRFPLLDDSQFPIDPLAPSPSLPLPN